MSQVAEGVHISSLVVHCRPDGLSKVVVELRAIENLEIAIEDPSGKLVVLLETESEHEILEVIDRLKEVDGILTTTMVYHEIDC